MAKQKEKKKGTWYKIKQIFWRMIATFTANGLATIGAGSLIGIGIGDAVTSTFAALLVLFVPATILVALKVVFSIAKV